MPTGLEPAHALPDVDIGLTSDEVHARRSQGFANVTTERHGRTVVDILRANLLTRFNLILGILLAVVLAMGEYRDALFGIVLVTNALVGIVQELRAKVALDRLSVVTAQRVQVVRDRELQTVRTEEIVLGDVVDVQTGDQLPVDGTVLAGSGLEVDESLLTGESEPVRRLAGELVRSGSFVVAGGGRYVATAVGDAAYAARIASEAKEFGAVRSELRQGTDTILRIGTWALLPAGVLLVVSQVRSADSLTDALRTSVAGVGAMIPEGLVLLTSVALAVGVIRLGRRGALVQELAAVEVLARVDVVCVDKTGTLTEGTLQVAGIERAGALAADELVLDALGALVAVEERPNESLRAIAEVGHDPQWTLLSAVTFASARKWSGASFEGQGSWLLGAPDVLLAVGDPLRVRADALAGGGYRVLALARTDALLEEELPVSVEAVALISLEEQIRPDAAETVRYFADQGVVVKVISGDHPGTVGTVASRVGIPGGDRPVDARTLPEDLDALGVALEEASVFGRVQPHQKREMVRALQRRGHVVAMTGDGVNDVLALKEADMGVAMGSGSGASRAVAQVVLVTDSFASLPAVVAEGRRVIGNVERVAKLFVTKSVYAFLLAVAVGVAQLPFPFFPRHLTIISSLTIGIPGFFLALASNEDRTPPGFVGRVARFAIPAGAIAAIATFTGYAIAGEQPGVTLIEERTCAVIVLFAVASWILVILSRPLNDARAALLAAIAAAFAVALATPGIREFFDLQLPSLIVSLATVGVAALAIGAIELGWQLIDRHHRGRSGAR